MGKLAEEANELGSVAARCIIQGINEMIPGEDKTNKRWLEEEIADVIANSELVCDHFGLNWGFINNRITEKKRRLRTWHAMAV